ncbi:MAG TPA: type II secretion system F family protein [Tepidisphaeraceae bacterium]|nr:type II secretion system F family protein [Tepidisphaeraceae bacterium]
MESESLFPILVAGCVAIGAWMITLVVVNLVKGDRRKLSQRLSGTSGSTGMANPAASIVIEADDAGLPPALARIKFVRGLHRWLVHANPNASVVKFLAISAGLAVGGVMVMTVVLDSAGLGLAGLAGGYLPTLAVGRKRSKRQKMLCDQLPEALDFLQRILRSGHSLSTGLAMMGEELPQPLASEFKTCYDQHSLGTPLEFAMREMARRIDSTDFAFFVTAVLIQRQTGGDLSQVLGNISGMIRQRTRLQQYVKAKTAEGRFTGYILVAFPILMFFIAASMNPDYKKNLLEDPTGIMLLCVAGGLVLLGLFAIRKITTVRV